METRRPLNRWLIFLGFSGLLCALFWSFLYPVTERRPDPLLALFGVEAAASIVCLRPIWRVSLDSCLPK